MFYQIVKYVLAEGAVVIRFLGHRDLNIFLHLDNFAEGIFLI
jgi:hypothetical protein